LALSAAFLDDLAPSVAFAFFPLVLLLVTFFSSFVFYFALLFLSEEAPIDFFTSIKDGYSF
jgi:hypothetical protein